MNHRKGEGVYIHIEFAVGVTTVVQVLKNWPKGCGSNNAGRPGCNLLGRYARVCIPKNVAIRGSSADGDIRKAALGRKRAFVH